MAGVLAAIVAQAEQPLRKLPFSEWYFGAIALGIFAVLAYVVWTYRDVANRHAHKPVVGATEHAGAPGVASHGTGDVTHHNERENH